MLTKEEFLKRCAHNAWMGAHVYDLVESALSSPPKEAPKEEKWEPRPGELVKITKERPGLPEWHTGTIAIYRGPSDGSWDHPYILDLGSATLSYPLECLGPVLPIDLYEENLHLKKKVRSLEDRIKDYDAKLATVRKAVG